MTYTKLTQNPPRGGGCILDSSQRRVHQAIETCKESQDLDTYIGPIDSKLPKCEKLSVTKHVSFSSCKLYKEVVEPSKLSIDQAYLYRISEAVISGHYPEDLSKLDPGAL